MTAPHSKFDVSEWVSSDTPPTARRPAALTYSVPPALIALLGTIGLHILVVDAVCNGFGGLHRDLPHLDERAGGFQRGESPSAMVLMQISGTGTEASVDTPETPFPQIALTALRIKVSTESMPSLPNVASLDDGAKSAAERGEGETAGKWHALYTGQISSRVNRAWRRPRSPVDQNRDQFFHCQTRIVQDRAGAVKEVLLVSCNGSPAWQQSLVAAILAASPLPAPPDPSVYQANLDITFDSPSYGPGAEESDYAL